MGRGRGHATRAALSRGPGVGEVPGEHCPGRRPHPCPHRATPVRFQPQPPRPAIARSPRPPRAANPSLPAARLRRVQNFQGPRPRYAPPRRGGTRSAAVAQATGTPDRGSRDRVGQQPHGHASSAGGARNPRPSLLGLLPRPAKPTQELQRCRTNHPARYRDRPCKLPVVQLLSIQVDLSFLPRGADFQSAVSPRLAA